MKVSDWSKKLSSLVGVFLVVILNKKLGLGLSDETVQDLVYLAMVYLGGQAVVDAASEKKT